MATIFYTLYLLVASVMTLRSWMHGWIKRKLLVYGSCMIWQYQNFSGIERQVYRLKARPNILLWYTADESGTLLPCMNHVAQNLRLVTQMNRWML